MGNQRKDLKSVSYLITSKELQPLCFMQLEIMNDWNTTKAVKEEYKSLSKTLNETVLYFLLINFLAIKLQLIKGAQRSKLPQQHTLKPLFPKLQEMLRYISFSVLSTLEILKYLHVLMMLLLPYDLKQPEVPCYSDTHQVTRSNPNLPEAKYRDSKVSPYIKYFVSRHISLNIQSTSSLCITDRVKTWVWGFFLYVWKNCSK